MTEQPYAIDLDLKEAQAMLEAFVPYIYEDVLYGKLGGRLPMLTPGALLLRINRLQALRGTMSAAQAATLAELAADFQAKTQEWRRAYLKKLHQEAESRLRDIQIYLKECQESYQLASGAYLPEAFRRTIIETILQVLPESDKEDLLVTVKKVDRGLRGYVEPCPFVWDAQLQPVYPSEVYWWLVNRPPKTLKDDSEK